MFRGETQISSLVQKLKTRKVSIYHACQLKDFKTYLKLNGVASREKMEAQNLPFTSFVTDSKDKSNGTWDKVFFNIQDYGKFFHGNSKSTPNVYGPILIRFDSEALLVSVDVAICLRSAGKSNFNRELESLPSLERIEQLFSYPELDPIKSNWVKEKHELIKIFKSDAKIIVEGFPEISCSIESQIVPWDKISEILIDPVILNSQKLIDRVIEKTKLSKMASTKISERSKIDKKYSELISSVERGALTLNDILNGKCSNELKEWAQNCYELDWQFKRFAEYLKKGTIDELKND